ncbi:mediator of RNA polymerase II transcription subunit 7-like [Histomonas meleagridis]|uniref:mediator of RNA polymerase II transcription subunit 7-like n=1 Tax=Histomonas meleagridis TaxID=135588 RepID=UPI00355A8D98|nr:mediator of RNA polymerase II transcription subunit 7-like [Histomonas meleagridis]KAH0801209.1 mediator of RNA polymerase II transcription subunit 7-like [Histomonas meleagridis]
MSNEVRNTSAFPPPPDEYKAFTSEEKIESIQPPFPPSGPIKVFGQNQTEEQVQTLEEQGIPVLYDESQPSLLELKKLNHKILFAFQKLVGIIAEGNESTDECLEHIKHLFLNAHYILHKLRSIQAYEHMHYCLQEQTRQLDAFKQDFDAKLEEISHLTPP